MGCGCKKKAETTVQQPVQQTTQQTNTTDPVVVKIEEVKNS